MTSQTLLLAFDWNHPHLNFWLEDSEDSWPVILTGYMTVDY